MNSGILPIQSLSPPGPRTEIAVIEITPTVKCCWKRHANEAKGTIKGRIVTLSPRLFVKPL